MSALNSVSAVFDVVKAARRVREAKSKPLSFLAKELGVLESTLNTLDRVEGKLLSQAPAKTPRGPRKRRKTTEKTSTSSAKPVKNPNRVAGGKRAYAARLAKQAGAPSSEAPDVPAEIETKKAARSKDSAKASRKPAKRARKRTPKK